MTLAAAVFFGEPVGWRRYLAIGIGFLGVMIIVRPGSEHFNAYALWALAAIGFIVARDLSTRRMSPGTPGMAVVFVTAVVLTARGGARRRWRPTGSRWRSATSPCWRWRRSACSSGYMAAFVAMRGGEIGFVQPFRYTLLLWAMLLGIVMFGEWPDAWMLTGSAIVVATGLFTFYREQRLARQGRL